MKLAAPERSAPRTLYSPEDEALLEELNQIMEGRSNAAASSGGGGGGGPTREALEQEVRDAQRAMREERMDDLQRPGVGRERSNTVLGIESSKKLLQLPITAAPDAKAPFVTSGPLIRDLGKSALMRARAYRDLDIKAQCKFWLEVLPAALTPMLFKQLFGTYNSDLGLFETRFSVREAIINSGPEKTEDTTLIKPAGTAELEEAPYTLAIQWTPLRIVRADFSDAYFDHVAHEHSGLFDYFHDGDEEDQPLLTDVFRVLFPEGMRATLVERLHPAVKRLAVDLFKSNGLELRFTRYGPFNEYMAVQFLVLEGKRSLKQWQEYWRNPDAGRESFDVEIVPTTGDPAMGAPGYTEARARSGTVVETSIAAQEAADLKAAAEREAAKKAKNEEAARLLAQVRKNSRVEWKDLAATGRIPNSVPAATATASATDPTADTATASAPFPASVATATASATSPAAAAPTASVPAPLVVLPLSPLRVRAGCECDSNTYCVKCSTD